MAKVNDISSRLGNEPKRRTGIRGLTITLTITFLIMGGMVLTISTFLDLYFSLQAQGGLIDTQQKLIAEDAANKVRSFINDKMNILEASTTIGELASVSPAEQETELDRLLGIDSSFRQLAFLDTSGKRLVLTSRLSDTVSGQFIGHENNEMLSRTEMGENYVGHVYIDEITSEPMALMAVPVRDIFGDPKGILVAEVNLKFMWNLVDSIKIGHNGHVYVVDNSGKLIAFGDISRVLRGENLTYLKEVNDFLTGNKSTQYETTELSTGIMGSQVVTNHVHLEDPDWAVVVELPVEEAYESLAVKIDLSLFSIIISFFLAVIAGVYLSRRITRPIIKLKDAAIEIGGGNLDAKIEVKTRNEIGELAHAFKQMVRDLKKSKSKLEEYSETLENKVKERTNELETKNKQLERFNKLAIGRELKMIELKKRIRELEEKSRN